MCVVIECLLELYFTNKANMSERDKCAGTATLGVVQYKDAILPV